MKTEMLLLTIGVAVALAVTEQTESVNGLPTSESDSNTNQNNDISKNESGLKKPEDQLEVKDSKKQADDGQLEIIIEETFGAQNEFVQPETFETENKFLQPESDISVIPLADSYIDDVPETSFVDSNLYRYAMANKVQDEIMDTAEGFVPVPILFRRRHQARRRFSKPIRRYFQKTPYRTPYYLYPYRGFYYPSSLRYPYY